LLTLPFLNITNTYAEDSELEALKERTKALEAKIESLQSASSFGEGDATRMEKGKDGKFHRVPHHFHSQAVTIHTFDEAPSLMDYHPAALMVGDHVLTYIAGTPVVTSPYLGERPAFDGSDLIINISSINQDVRLMAQRMLLYKHLSADGYNLPETPIIALSGSLVPYGMITWPMNGGQTGDFDLGSAELDIAIALNEWVEGFIGISYDSAPPFTGMVQRVSNSNFRLGKGFVNVGNLDKTPFYMTAGQIYVPFGRYSSSMISSPFPLAMARTKTRVFQLGYRQHVNHGLFAAAYGFKSDTTYGNSANGGVNLGYDLLSDKVRGQFGVSYINNIADAEGMQNTGGGTGDFLGFGATTANENVRKTAAFDVNAYVLIGNYGLTAEWVTATDDFRVEDLSYNLQGAKPQAGNFEISYSFTGASKPTSIAVGYGFTRQALALGLPKQRFSGVLNVSWWRDTVQSLEYRHDIDYGSNNTAGGRGTGVSAMTGTGHNSDTITAQFGLYF
jgi:hypothetical protein